MRSFIRSITDYKSIPVKREILISPLGEDEIAKKIHALSRKRKQVIQPDVIEKGDVVMLTLQSDEPHFNKKMLPVTVGLGLYDSALEALLIGLKNGETKKICVDNCDVIVTVRSITRTLFPEPTKEEVQELALSLDPPQNFTTVAAYVDYLQCMHKENQRQSAIYETMQEILNTVLTTSDWCFDEAEVTAQYNQSIHELDTQAQQDLHKSYAELTDDDIKAHIGPENRAELEEMVRNEAESFIATVLFFGHIKEIEPAAIDLNDEEIMDYSSLEAYVRSIITYKEM